MLRHPSYPESWEKVQMVLIKKEVVSPEEWEGWRNQTQRLDPTRPWNSSDGEEDGKGILSVTIGHYGGFNGDFVQEGDVLLNPCLQCKFIRPFFGLGWKDRAECFLCP